MMPPTLESAAGIGLRPAHHADLLATRPPLGWVEVITENFFASGGNPRQVLRRVREHYPVVLHGVSLSIGSVDALDEGYLDRVAELAAEVEPAWISDHLSWGGVDGARAHDLWPMPTTHEALEHLVARVARVQDRLGRRLLLENVSAYLAFARSDMAEWELLTELTARTGCGVLLDVNNVWVSARNLGFDPHAYLAGIPVAAVGQMHLAGHRDLGTHLLDSHDRPVPEEVWTLYRAAVRRFGAVPVCIERDDDLPPLAELVAEALRAADLQEATEARHAA